MLSMGLTSAASANDEVVLTRIDFEDRETATASWSHVFEQAPGLPQRSLFFDAVVDETVAFEGGSSLRLDLRGSSISYRMRPEAAVSIQEDAEYLVSARLRTDGLRHATARLEIRIVDGGRLPRESGSTGDAVADATIGIVHATLDDPVVEGDWTDLIASVRTEGPVFEGVEDLRLFLSLQVVQPGFDESETAAILPNVRLEDIDGRAWFDEIEVRRSPRLRVSPVADSGIRRGEGPIEVAVVVDDPTRRIVDARLGLWSVDGRVVDRCPVPIDRPETQTVALSPDGPGWFDIVLETREQGGRTAVRRHSVLVIPEFEGTTGREAPRFGVSITGWTPDSLPALGRTLDVLDPDAVEMPIWPEENDRLASLEGVESIRRLLDHQRRAGREAMIAVDRLHGGLAGTERVEPHAVWAALQQDENDVWRHAIGDWMERLGTTISRWRVASGPTSSVAPALFTELADAFVADPILLVTTPFDRAGVDGDDGESCRIGTSDLGSGAQDELSSDLADATLILSPPPSDWTARDRIDDAARRGLAAWRAGAGRILLAWNPAEAPDPALVAWSGLARGLGSRRPVGDVRASDTITCLVADDGYDVAVVAWSELLDRTETLRLPVGVDSVEVLELDGRRRRISTDRGMLELEVGSTPRFVRGADRLPTLLAASTRFEPSTLGLGGRSQSVELVLRNPTAVPLEGDLRFDPPSGWTIEPDRPRLRAAAGETVRIPLTVSWSGPQALGITDVPVRLDVRSPRAVRIPVVVPITLESDALAVTADWSIARNASGGESPIILTVEIENVGDRPLDLELAVSAWQVGRERRTITELSPGDRVVRRLRIAAGLGRLAGTDLRVEVRELDGPESVALRVPVVGDADARATAVVPAP